MNATPLSLVRANASGPDEEARRSAIASFTDEKYEEALDYLAQALLHTPNDAELHNWRARTLDRLGRSEEALGAVEAALKINPANFFDLKNRGVLLRRLSRPEEAVQSFESALKQRPNDVEVILARALLLNDLNRRQEALGECQRAFSLAPDDVEVLNARGRVYENLQRYDEALSDFDRILEIRPGQLDGLNNRAMVLARQGSFQHALDLYSESLALCSDQPQAAYNRSLVRLALGEWTIGLRDFELRRNLPTLQPTFGQSDAPLWLGQSSLKDKTIFVHHEQGYGDTLQCVRYVPALAAMGAKVVLSVPPTLRRLMATLPCECEVISTGDSVPPHDLQSPLMSLMLAFGTVPDAITAKDAYLQSGFGLIGRAAETATRPRIGIVWSGRRYAPINYPRDMTLEAIRPLLSLDADFVSLQQDLSDEEFALAEKCESFDTRSVRSASDFADTAAIVDSLDLVICVDTAIAHLAGALGKKVWLMNRFASCWRWLQTGTRTGWYPSMRIYRQEKVGSWDALLTTVSRDAGHFIQTWRQGRLNPEWGRESKLMEAAPNNGIYPRRLDGHLTDAANPEIIRLVCATRMSTEDFFSSSALGRSLPFYQTFPRGQRIELRLFPNNREGLPTVYNIAIEEAKKSPAILVFIHDDLYLSDYFWASRICEGLDSFGIIGLAGNKNRVPKQASWMYLDDKFKADADENLSGVLGHGQGFPNLKQLSIYGDPCQQVKLLDGVLLAVQSQTLHEKRLTFDVRFSFDFYDLDFCRQAELREISMGTWAISVIHASAGTLGIPRWRAAYQKYLEKYSEE